MEDLKQQLPSVADSSSCMENLNEHTHTSAWLCAFLYTQLEPLSKRRRGKQLHIEQVSKKRHCNSGLPHIVFVVCRDALVFTKKAQRFH